MGGRANERWTEVRGGMERKGRKEKKGGEGKVKKGKVR